MDPWRHVLNPPNASNRKENELFYNALFNNELSLQVPISNDSAGFAGSYGSYGSFGSIDMLVGNPSGHSAAIPIASQDIGSAEMGRLRSSGSLDYAWSFGSGSPAQEFRRDLFQVPSANPSPMLAPQSSSTNPTLFPELDLSATAIPSNSYEEQLSPLSVGSSNWSNVPSFSSNTEVYPTNHFGFPNTTKQEFNDFFASEMFLDSLQDNSAQTSPVIVAQSTPEMAPNDISNIPPLVTNQAVTQPRPIASPQGIGIIQVGMNRTTGTMSPQRSVSGNGRRAVGRRGPLDPVTRRKAASMRGHACESCRRRKASCDKSIPCRSCVRYYGVRLLQSPCRGKMLESLAEGFMKGPIFPKVRTLQSFLGTSYKFHQEVNVKLKFGFGSSLAFPMKIVMPTDSKSKLVHRHIVYQWPPQANEVTAKCSCQHHVFPAVIADETNVKTMLDNHLGELVDNHFDGFPAYESVLRVLTPIYTYYRKLSSGEPKRLLRQALKLLTLVHIGGDTQICPRDATARLIATKVFGHSAMGSRPKFPTCPSNLGSLPTPCFIRGQLGGVMPALAEDLMKDVLAALELMSLGRECSMWANACAAFAVFVMAVESIEYHTKKISFHAESVPRGTASDPIPVGPLAPQEVARKTPPSSPTPSAMDEGLKHLIAFYKSCYGGCHLRLSDEPTGRQRSGSGGAAALTSEQRNAQEALVAELKGVIANSQSYLFEKSTSSCRTEDDLSSYFDRNLARFFLTT